MKEEEIEGLCSLIRNWVDDAIEFARENEILLLAIAISHTRRKKRKLHLGYVGTALFYLSLLYGGKRALGEVIGMKPASIRPYMMFAGMVSCEELLATDKGGEVKE